MAKRSDYIVLLVAVAALVLFGWWYSANFGGGPLTYPGFVPGVGGGPAPTETPTPTPTITPTPTPDSNFPSNSTVGPV